ncbi:SDH family Clp fold serine proteinase [Candidatus Binatus sp.]|jgi:hypothetical protein|uniref:SDH family Clp fold serine proteinase n=1 Tax=Candidatus Binatus sp. TaxID=2811406 RepID=UPI003D0E424B
MAAPAQHPSVQKFTKLVTDLERERKSRIFCIIHSKAAHICSLELPEYINRRGHFDRLDTLELLLHSPGGDADFAFKLMKFFRRRCKRLNVIVPLMAKSAATIMSLGADAIFMGEFAELGPVDVQIQDPVERGAEPLSPLDEFKSMEFLRDYAMEVFDFFTLLVIRQSGMSVKEAIHESGPYVTAMVRPLFEKIDPLEVGGHRRALAVGEEYAKRLLKLVGNPAAASIVNRLVWQYPSHEFGIDFDEAAELKLPVKELDRRQDERLSTAIMELVDAGITFNGFAGPAKVPARKAKVSQDTQRPPRRMSGGVNQNGHRPSAR